MEERLQKIIARAGVASRRSAETLITEGRVSVNRVTVAKLGAKADPKRDEIRVDGRLISSEVSKIYIVLNKPRGYVTTLSDPEGRPVVIQLIRGIAERIYPVGRLDYDSEGLLILTNDGDFSQRLQHPRYNVSKTYLVKVDGRLSNAELKSMTKGIDLDDGIFKASQVSLEKTNPKSTWIKVTIHEGRNRIVRRALERLGHSASRLIRVAIGDLQLGELKEGAYRHLSDKEVRQLLGNV
ncbi:MAG: pseudouridine synthase [Smithellaceae bacterium]|nr:pseudouridine synthase [Smithellaceae bacterium]